MSGRLTRKEFIGGLVAAAGTGCVSPAARSLAEPRHGFRKMVMFKLGVNNMAGDDYLTATWADENARLPKPKFHRVAAKRLRFDEAVWRESIGLAKRRGLNAVLIDLHEAVVYPSHPEIATEGAWSPDRLRDELRRLRAMGLEPLPKLNFSTTHSAWQGVWRRRTSTPEYYRFCADLIGDVCEIFDRPALFHIGMDEEWPKAQPDEPLVLCRQGDLWFHDCRFLIDEVEKHGVRAWMWSDVFSRDVAGFLRNIPKSVLISNWYYDEIFDPAAFPKDFPSHRYWAYEKIEKAGYDQLPTGSNWSGPRNIDGTVRHCRKVIAPERLMGFLMASWKETTSVGREKLLASINQLADAIDLAGL